MSEAELRKKAKAELDESVKKARADKEKASEFLYEHCMDTVRTLIKHRDNEDKPEISLNAAKYLAKLQGFEVEKHEHTGDLGLFISDSHAKRVRDAASK